MVQSPKDDPIPLSFSVSHSCFSFRISTVLEKNTILTMSWMWKYMGERSSQILYHPSYITSSVLQMGYFICYTCICFLVRRAKDRAPANWFNKSLIESCERKNNQNLNKKKNFIYSCFDLWHVTWVHFLPPDMLFFFFFSPLSVVLSLSRVALIVCTEIVCYPKISAGDVPATQKTKETYWIMGWWEIMPLAHIRETKELKRAEINQNQKKS